MRIYSDALPLRERIAQQRSYHYLRWRSRLRHHSRALATTVTVLSITLALGALALMGTQMAGMPTGMAAESPADITSVELHNHTVTGEPRDCSPQECPAGT